MPVYIQRLSQISNQLPFSDEWFEHPVVPSLRLNKFQCPDFKKYISGAQMRRMTRIVKCAVSSAANCMEGTDATMLDAIFAGTGLGCIESTENVLNTMLDEDEENISPSAFMQSTHNTLASQIAISMKCHGYNVTYSHRHTSFDSALLDAVVQFQLGEIKKALVCGTDEMSDAYFEMYDNLNVWKKGTYEGRVNAKDAFSRPSNGTIAGENAVSFLLQDTKDEQTFCEVVDSELLYRPNDERIRKSLSRMLMKAQIKVSEISGVVVAKNGDESEDSKYDDLLTRMGIIAPRIAYKHLFGDTFTMSSMGIYVAAKCLKEKKVPSHLTESGETVENVRSLLVVNLFRNMDYSLTLLKVCTD